MKTRKLSRKELTGACLLATLFCEGAVQKGAEKRWLELEKTPKRKEIKQ